MSRQYAPQLALIAVITALVRGLLRDEGFATTVWTALAAGLVFYPLGLLIGEIAGRLLAEQIAAQLARPTERTPEP